MFRGINTVSLDSKNRISIPIRYREILAVANAANQLIVTIDPEERCLLMYPMLIWVELEQKIANLPSFNYAARRIQRLLIGHATELILDNQGRILLPQELTVYAGLQKNIILVGQGKKIEIWDNQYWIEKRDDWLQSCSLESRDLPDDLQLLSL